MMKFTLFIFLFAQNLFAQKIVFLGDSLTEGYGVAKESAFPARIEFLAHKDGKTWKVINSGVSGATTASAPSRMTWILKSNPDAVLLLLGANDGLRGIDVKESEKNLKAAIKLAKTHKIKILLGGIYMPPNYGKEYAEKFKRMFENVAKSEKVFFIPFILENVGGNPKLNLPDGIHPNEEGHKVIAETIYKIIKDKL